MCQIAMQPNITPANLIYSAEIQIFKKRVGSANKMEMRMITLSDFIHIRTQCKEMTV